MDAFVYVVIFLIVIVLVGKSLQQSKGNISNNSGERGEQQVQNALERNNKVYPVIKDIYFLDGEKSVQIDHIAINKSGIFVIETKNLGGKIYGNDLMQNWEQYIGYKNVKKHLFYNPVKQNNSHIFHLSKIIPKNIPIYSLVVFVKADISNVYSKNVIKIEDIKRRLNCEKEILDDVQVYNLYQLINEHKANDKITKEEHINNIHNDLWKIENNICPLCGGKLVLKKGQYGDFYGCSNYPKCKFKKKIDE